MRIIEHFDNGAKLYPDNIAFIDVGSDKPGLSYAEAEPLTQAVAGAIHARGYSCGGHVGVLAPNCTSAFLALLGLFRAECVWLPINPRNTVPVNADLLGRFDG
jgi:acyl-CoA synthetase (AMP-forming)/AMP-acid ligase II